MQITNCKIKTIEEINRSALLVSVIAMFCLSYTQDDASIDYSHIEPSAESAAAPRGLSVSL